ncbi:alpha/beta hydrolase [Rhizomonospora bruguierae]|uniref:alpha/beta hydrolase n=1 Tax=Rhizomonospora bruguierae TaxID=1581705 RepID=UPI0020BDD40A|nr:alpha/beta hydrolase [Micromonospora sp. NBRC 107566]
MSRPHRRAPLVALLAGFVAVVATAGCFLPVVMPTGGADPDHPVGLPPSSSPGGPAWSRCDDVPAKLVGQGARGMRYDCATISVPADWGGGAGGDKLELSLIRIRSADQSRRIGSLLVNPGGPGASGVDTAVYLSFGPSYGGLPTEITRRFDIVGFDPRGVGRSSPIKCMGDRDMDAYFGADPDPRTQEEFDQVAAIRQKLVAGCVRKYGDDLRYYSTEQTARDIDAIRAAVGDDKTTYLGYSYGTLLGATYAQLFPEKVRALVLDGAVDPEQDIVAGSESQAKGFERAFTNFTTWCRNTPKECRVAPDARAAMTDALEKARSSPMRASDGREVTAGWALWAAVSSLYTEQGWKELADALEDYQRGNPRGILKLADRYAERTDAGAYSNLFDANSAINCTDSDTSLTANKIRSYQEQWRAKYPLFGAPIAVDLITCAQWSAPRDPYPTGAAKGAPPIVVVGTTGDPATPYEQTGRLADMLGVGHVLTWQGEGHTAYPQTPCVTNAVDEYLINLTVPADGKTCPAR